MNKLHQKGDILNQKYQITEVIGEGGTGITYRAIAQQTQQQVAIKNLSLQGLNNWKQIELFEREAKILANLNHPAIPKYIDYFCLDCDNSRDFYIVQQLAPGKSLFQLVKDGWRTTEAEIKLIAEQILEILIYLHELVPAVVHRDIKPQNLIRSDEGKIFLVDFGAVQNTYYTNFKQGSTVVGTYGFMAPEQFRGQAIAATDLYNLGATLVYLLTHHPPAELPHKNLKINFRDRVQISHQFATWLDKLIEPNIEDRFASASSALTELRSSTFTTRESFNKLFQTKFNLVAVGLAAAIGVASMGIMNVSKTEEIKIAELEKNSAQLCSNLEQTQEYLNNDGDPDLIVDYNVEKNKTQASLLFCLLNFDGGQDTEELFKTIKLAIDAGANLEARNDKNQTPIVYWLSKQIYRNSDQYPEFTNRILNLLIDSGANINTADASGNTPLLILSYSRNADLELIKKLIDLGAKVNVKYNNSNTPLTWAIERNNLELLQILLDRGGNLHAINRSGETLLFKAVEGGNLRIVKLLLDLGIDPNIPNNSNQTAIFKVFRNRNYGERQAIIELLLAKGAKIDLGDHYNKTFLSYAASNTNISSAMIGLLLNQKLETNSIDNNGNTPLSYAVESGNFIMAKALIDRGADVNLKDKQGRSLLLKATYHNNPAIVRLLKQHGAKY